MRKRTPTEEVEPYRRRVHAPEGHQLRARLSSWADSVLRIVTEAVPDMPAGIEDRDADMWDPLLAIADAAGERWPAAARATAVTLVTDSKESTPSLGVALLADVREVFGDHDTLTTAEILAGLLKLDEAPWGDLRGKPVDARGLANRLRQYGVKSTTVRIGEMVAKGYRREDFHDPWSRYLPSLAPKSVKPRTEQRGSAEPIVGPPPDESVTSVTSVTPQVTGSGSTVDRPCAMGCGRQTEPGKILYAACRKIPR